MDKDKSKYPIVTVNTADGLQLAGYYSPIPGSKSVLINIHGTASNFYAEGFEAPIANKLDEIGISTLFTNNRGHDILATWQKTGAANEKFEDCLIDIDAWIQFALEQGHEHVLLSGHSLGTEKVVYYMAHGQYKDTVEAVILLADEIKKWLKGITK